MRNWQKRFHYKGLWLLIIISLTLFLMLSWLVSSGKTDGIDGLVKEKLPLINSPAMDIIMKYITMAGRPAVFFFIFLIPVFIFIYQKRFKDALVLFSGVSGSIVIQYILKEMFERLRPAEALPKDIGYSFPSGHATASAAFFFLLIYLFIKKFTIFYSKILFACVSILLILLVGFSRIYLNLHWMSDVIAGFAVGLFWASLVLLIFKPM